MAKTGKSADRRPKFALPTLRPNPQPVVGSASKETVPALVASVSDESKRVRRSAAVALGQMGPSDREAVPALQKALKDEDEIVRRTAQAALNKIKAKK